MRLEQVDPAVDHDAEAGLRLERRTQALVAEPDALELAALVLEREVGVARARDRDAADLALDPEVAQPLVPAHGLADRPAHIADGEDPEPEGPRRHQRLAGRPAVLRQRVPCRQRPFRRPGSGHVLKPASGTRLFGCRPGSYRPR